MNKTDVGSQRTDLEQQEMDFFFWIGQGGDSISVTEEEFNELFEAKRKLQNDYINVDIENVAELGNN